MTTLDLAAPAILRRERSEARARRAPRRWPIENTFLFLISFIVYMVVADYLVIHLHYTNADAYTRVADATYVLYSRDPHLGAIGFIWPPLPGLLNIPILALQHWFPFLITHAFAGSVQAALFGAGSVVLINLGLRRAGVILPVRWLVLVMWIANPMTALYSAQGMSEAPFVFFVIASLLSFMRWTDTRKPAELAALGVLVGLGTLVRVEMIPMALAVGAGVFFCSVKRRTSWRELETQMLLYALPAAFVLALWIGSTWVIERDPLYIFHSSYSQQAAATGGLRRQRGGRLHPVAQRGQLHRPPIPAALSGGRGAGGRCRVAHAGGQGSTSRAGLLGLGLPVPLVDMYLLHSGNLPLILRYQIYVIPYAVVLGIFLLKDLRKVSPRVVSVAALRARGGHRHLQHLDLRADVGCPPRPRGVGGDPGR